MFSADFPYLSDRGDGTYSNPVLFADYSDPDVIRVGGSFYMTASTFNFVPGLPVLKSADLVNWTVVGCALARIPSARYDEVHPGCAVWAPALRFRNGRFHIFFPMPDEGVYAVSASDPAGPWSEPELVMAGKGLIDPCPLWDDDGAAYLAFAYAGSRAGIKHRIHVRPMDPETFRPIGEGAVVFDGTADHPTLEGPKFHKKDGWYYLSAPAGGVPAGWQLILRSRSVYGPYEPKIVLAQRGSPVNGPHQGALVDDAAGDWWFFHFQEHLPYGRICHLQPVRWEDGWPLIGVDQPDSGPERGVGRPVLSYRKPAGSSPRLSPESSDEFDSPALGFQWAFPANPAPGAYSLSARPGFLRLSAAHVPHADLGASPRALSQRVPAAAFRVETSVDFAPASAEAEAGLAVFGIDRLQIGLAERQGADGARRRLIEVKRNGTRLCAVPAPEGAARLLLDFAPGGACRFAMADGDGGVRWIGPSMQAKEGVWVGARIGLYCIAGGPFPSADYADFDYFRLIPPAASCPAPNSGT